MAVQATGLICVVLSSKWAEAKRHEQAASLIFWWPRIELQLKTAQAGDSIPVPHTFSSDDLSIKKINYEAAKIADAKSKR